MTSKAYANAVDASAQQGGRRNLIINGAMQVAQRGTSQTARGYGSVDRWWFNLDNVGGTITQLFDDTEGYYMRQSGQSVSGAYAYTSVELEKQGKSLPFKSGQAYTFSMRYRSTKPCRVDCGFRDGVGSGTYVEVSSGNILGSGSGDWETVSFTFTVNATPSANNKVLQINLFDSDGLVDRDITQVQLEVGSVATPFEHRSYGEELAACQRYYQTHTGIVVNAYSAVAALGTIQPPVSLRAVPTISASAPISLDNPAESNYVQSSTTISGWGNGYANDAPYSAVQSSIAFALGNFSGMEVDDMLYVRNNGGYIIVDAEL
jgi:hypothetical protein